MGVALRYRILLSAVLCVTCSAQTYKIRSASHFPSLIGPYVAHQSAARAPPIDAVVIVETSIFGRDECGAHVLGNPLEWDIDSPNVCEAADRRPRSAPVGTPL